MQIVGKDHTTSISIKKDPLSIPSKDKLVKVLPIKKAYKKGALKRISPFLLLACLMPLLFVYSFFTHKINTSEVFIRLFLLLFLEVNVLFADFVIWNYYRYKKIVGIWLVEGLIAYGIIYFMI